MRLHRFFKAFPQAISYAEELFGNMKPNMHTIDSCNSDTFSFLPRLLHDFGGGVVYENFRTGMRNSYALVVDRNGIPVCRAHIGSTTIGTIVQAIYTCMKNNTLGYVALFRHTEWWADCLECRKESLLKKCEHFPGKNELNFFVFTPGAELSEMMRIGRDPFLSRVPLTYEMIHFLPPNIQKTILKDILNPVGERFKNLLNRDPAYTRYFERTLHDVEVHSRTTGPRDIRLVQLQAKRRGQITFLGYMENGTEKFAVQSIDASLLDAVYLVSRATLLWEPDPLPHVA